MRNPGLGSFFFLLVATTFPVYGEGDLAYLQAYVDEGSDDAPEVLETLPVVAPGPGWESWGLRFRSQTWLDESVVSRPDWVHDVFVMVPPKAVSNALYIHLGGGENEGREILEPDLRLVALAEQAQMAIVEVRQLPNQRLIFDNDGVGRREDDLVAYGWKRFLDGGDRPWIPQLPMLRAAARSVDIGLGEVAKAGIMPDQIIVGGASKRGWVSWLLPLVEPRVTAIVPILIDVLSVRESMQHHFDVYGKWSHVLRDYVHHGVMDAIDSPRFDAILTLIDPIRYVDALTIPKLIVNAGNDQFFLPDSSQFYRDDLEGPVTLRYLPNTGHNIPAPGAPTLAGTSPIDTMAAFLRAMARGDAFPQLELEESDDTLTVRSTHPMSRVVLWQAQSRVRDFRMRGFRFPRYRDQPVEVPAQAVSFTVEKPQSEKPWQAFFYEVWFEDDEAAFPISTHVLVEGN